MPDMTQLRPARVTTACPIMVSTGCAEDLPTSEPSTSYCCSLREVLAHRSRQIVNHRNVPHLKQSYNWDCGLACVLMVLKASNIHQCDYDLLRHLCPTTSVWTIDLAHLLRRFGLEVCFCTVTLGPNPAFADEGFYMEHMQDDERRVSQLFRDATAVGIVLQQRSVSGEELQQHLLAGDRLVVVLVDKRKLDPWLITVDACLPALCGMELGYVGHYLLLVGFDSELQEYIIRDPAATVAEQRVTAAALEQARKSFGTDEDLLIVSCPPWHAHDAAVQQQQQQQQQCRVEHGAR